METGSQGPVLTERHTWRRVFVRLHRYVGLSIAAFLALAGLTGSVLAFEPELDAALNPHLFRTAVSSSPPLPLDELFARIEKADPRIQVTAALMPPDRGASYLVYVGSRDPARPVDFDQVFVDPRSGEVLGRRMWGSCCLQRERFVPFIYQIHMTMFLPAVAGALLMGGVAIAWLFHSVTGLVLAWPRSRTPGHGWRQALGFKRGAKRFRTMFDLHRLAGLWPWPLLILSAVTGISLNLREQVMLPLVELFSPLTPGPLEDPPVANPKPVLGFTAAALSAVDSVRHEHRKPAVLYATHVREIGLYGFALGDPVGNPRNGLGPSWVYVDDRTGAVRHRQVMGEGSAADIFFQAQLPLHSGRIAGTPGRVFALFFGLAVALLSLTGLYLWWRKRWARISHQTRAAAKLS